MDNQFNSSYHLPYSQSQQSPAQQASMGAYALPGQTQSQQQAPQSASQHQSPAQQDASHPTLPPLQSAQNGYTHFGSMSYAHNNSGAPTPTTAHTPTSSSIANGANNAYSHVSPASAMGPPNAYAHYPMSQSMMYPSATTTTNSSLPPSSSGNGLAALRPAIATSLAPLSSLSAPHHLGQQASFLQNEEAPTHVVGSQGRRGILPSAPGRPNATTTGGTASIKNMMPQKDADGKFPCPHCNKTYLHAKHLKRHMLRRKLSRCPSFASHILTRFRHWRSAIFMPSLQRHLLKKRHSQTTLSEMLNQTWQPNRC